jgi:hypothetical protein
MDFTPKTSSFSTSFFSVWAPSSEVEKNKFYCSFKACTDVKKLQLYHSNAVCRSRHAWCLPWPLYSPSLLWRECRLFLYRQCINVSPMRLLVLVFSFNIPNPVLLNLSQYLKKLWVMCHFFSAVLNLLPARFYENLFFHLYNFCFLQLDFELIFSFNVVVWATVVQNDSKLNFL